LRGKFSTAAVSQNRDRLFARDRLGKAERTHKALFQQCTSAQTTAAQMPMLSRAHQAYRLDPPPASVRSFGSAGAYLKQMCRDKLIEHKCHIGLGLLARVRLLRYRSEIRMARRVSPALVISIRPRFATTAGGFLAMTLHDHRRSDHSPANRS
jgi:hypothetical protein